VKIEALPIGRWPTASIARKGIVVLAFNVGTPKRHMSVETPGGPTNEIMGLGGVWREVKGLKSLGV
jgi:hypothetical protein